MERLYLISVHDPETFDQFGSGDIGAVALISKDIREPKAALTRLMREIEGKEREEAKYKGLTEEEII